MPEIYSGEVLENRSAGELFLLTVSIGKSIDIIPGQFFLIRIDREDTVLRRAFSIFDKNDDRLSFLYRVVGKGTGWLSERKTGYELNIFGPLGNGFSLVEGRSLLVGGGTGMAPLYYLGKNINGDVDFLLGAQRKTFWSEELLSRYRDIGNLELVTEDGSSGKKGMVTQYIKNACYTKVYACGPMEMLKSIDIDVPAEVSLESVIACGFGACRGCVVETVSGEYKRVCKDGPIFDLREISI